MAEVSKSPGKTQTTLDGSILQEPTTPSKLKRIRKSGNEQSLFLPDISGGVEGDRNEQVEDLRQEKTRPHAQSRTTPRSKNQRPITWLPTREAQERALRAFDDLQRTQATANPEIGPVTHSNTEIRQQYPNGGLFAPRFPGQAMASAPREQSVNTLSAAFQGYRAAQVDDSPEDDAPRGPIEFYHMNNPRDSVLSNAQTIVGDSVEPPIGSSVWPFPPGSSVVRYYNAAAGSNTQQNSHQITNEGPAPQPRGPSPDLDELYREASCEAPERDPGTIEPGESRSQVSRQRSTEATTNAPIGQFIPISDVRVIPESPRATPPSSSSSTQTSCSKTIHSSERDDLEDRQRREASSSSEEETSSETSEDADMEDDQDKETSSSSSSSSSSDEDDEEEQQDEPSPTFELPNLQTWFLSSAHHSESWIHYPDPTFILTAPLPEIFQKVRECSNIPPPVASQKPIKNANIKKQKQILEQKQKQPKKEGGDDALDAISALIQVGQREWSVQIPSPPGPEGEKAREVVRNMVLQAWLDYPAAKVVVDVYLRPVRHVWKKGRR